MIYEVGDVFETTEDYFDPAELIIVDAIKPDNNFLVLEMFFNGEWDYYLASEKYLHRYYRKIK